MKNDTFNHDSISLNHLVCLEGVAHLLNDGFVGGGVRGGEHEHKVEDEGVALVLLVLDTFGTAHNFVVPDFPEGKTPSLIHTRLPNQLYNYHYKMKCSALVQG